MAAPLKHGLNYFPLDVEIFDEDEIALVSEEFGILAELILVKLLCRIYKDRGYYACWNDDIAAFMAKRDFSCSVKSTLINDVVQALVRRGFFDKKLFDTFHILTSQGIQSRYIYAKRLSRASQLIDSRYNLLPKVKSKKRQTTRVINDDNSIVNVNNSLKESKVKESKVKESKAKESKAKESKAKESKAKEINFNSFSGEKESPFPSETDMQGGAVEKDFFSESLKRNSPSKVDYQSILNSYNRICGEKLPQVTVLSAERKVQIKTRALILRELDKTWDDFFTRVVSSGFLTGDNNHGFQASFDWIINPSNFAKIMNGNYDNHPKKQKTCNSGPIEVDYNKKYTLEEAFKKY